MKFKTAKKNNRGFTMAQTKKKDFYSIHLVIGIGIMPVSYTHLDVYKRQVLSPAAVKPALRPASDTKSQSSWLPFSCGRI